ncbi:AraC family transcriptional regulator [Pseudomonas alkylphenolica]|uniref:AraC family transcriptional regulator n=1 Tax=Pseudomonas alkylphenolica TaxID=237609 RepID=A0A443ZEK5_9PSED|nr:AraC family transcriptional regulator [Pseudomonas alkylphenolica]RWU17117.1 AraC family transcriptional regulator [Pseudomonas alkylphenolica]
MARLNYTVYAEALLLRYAEVFRPFLGLAGLSSEVLERPDAIIPLSKYTALLEITAAHTDPDLGLHLGLGLPGEAPQASLLGGFGHAARSAASVRALLEFVTRYMVVHAQANEFTWQLRGNLLEMCYRLTDPSITERRQDAEYAMAVLFTRLRAYTGDRFAPVRVDFVHPQPADITQHRQAFQCPIRFDQPGNVLVWPAAMLDAPLVTADPRLFQALLPGLEQERRRRLADSDLSMQISLAIEADLKGGKVGLEEVASQLCMSKRTLQRRLSELNVEFNELVEDVRQARAMTLVRQSSLSLTEIAMQLGYNEASSFTRAFRRWTGLTPREYRQQIQH